MKILKISNLKVVLLLTIIVAMNSACSKRITDNIGSDEVDIRMVLVSQQKAWNIGNLESFMSGYWHSDKLKFTGNRGVTYGWQNTLDNYKKSYPTNDKMGELIFSVISLERLGKDSFYMLGKFQLIRKSDKPEGYFMLIWKRINGKWRIISDMTAG